MNCNRRHSIIKALLTIIIVGSVFASIARPGMGLSAARYLHRQDTIPSDTLRLRDTLNAKDSDSTYVPDSLLVPDSLADSTAFDWTDTIPGFWKVDSATIAYLDSASTAFFDSLSTDLPDKTDIRRAERRIKKEYRDSVKENTPRILETFAVPDSMRYEKILTWTAERNFNELKFAELDTSFNYHYYDYPYLKKDDVNAVHLGPVGSATQQFNYFQRDRLDEFPQFAPYLTYSYTPDNMPQFNTKTPHTELAYWGNLISSSKDFEESSVRVLTTQNITPALNFTLAFLQFGSRGMLANEHTDSRTLMVGVNYLGKKYLLNAGYLGQTVRRDENGGLASTRPFSPDTLIEFKAVKGLDVNLSDADNMLKRRSAFLTHSYTIPMNFFRKDRDSIPAGEGTTAYIGHSMDFSSYSKAYSDVITTSDKKGRAFYQDNFFLHPTMSADSSSMRKFDNRVFLKLQPFAPDAIVSKINGGIGYEFLSYYIFDPSFYLYGSKNENYHNTYVYAGASGRFRKYFEWNADGRYYFSGYNMNDFHIGGDIKVSFYPWDKGIHLKAKAYTSLREPSPYEQKIYFNHHQWENDFSKISETHIEGSLEIPKWHTKLFFGYALNSGHIYYDENSIVRQCEKPVSVMSAYLNQDFRVWKFHFDNRVLFQLSSDQSVLPLPKLALNLRYYIEFSPVSNIDIMNLQIGVNGTYTTSWYGPAYSPDLGVFYNQQDEKIGNAPYFDIFVNAQWKQVSVFIKYVNALGLKQLPEWLSWGYPDYFSAYHYIKPLSSFKFGIYWPFFIK